MAATIDIVRGLDFLGEMTLKRGGLCVMGNCHQMMNLTHLYLTKEDLLNHVADGSYTMTRVADGAGGETFAVNGRALKSGEYLGSAGGGFIIGAAGSFGNSAGELKRIMRALHGIDALTLTVTTQINLHIEITL